MKHRIWVLCLALGATAACQGTSQTAKQTDDGTGTIAFTMLGAADYGSVSQVNFEVYYQNTTNPADPKNYQKFANEATGGVAEHYVAGVTFPSGTTSFNFFIDKVPMGPHRAVYVSVLWTNKSGPCDNVIYEVNVPFNATVPINMFVHCAPVPVTLVANGTAPTGNLALSVQGNTQAAITSITYLTPITAGFGTSVSVTAIDPDLDVDPGMLYHWEVSYPGFPEPGTINTMNCPGSFNWTVTGTLGIDRRIVAECWDNTSTSPAQVVTAAIDWAPLGTTGTAWVHSRACDPYTIGGQWPDELGIVGAPPSPWMDPFNLCFAYDVTIAVTP